MDLKIVYDILKPFNEENNLTIYNVSFIKEADMLILQVLLDQKGGISLEMLAKANEYLSERLDNYDSDMDEYMLEVSSPGAEKELRNDEEINEAIEKYIHVEVPNNIYEGYLLSYIDNVLEIKINLKGRIKKIKINKDDIKLIRLAVKI